MANATRFKIDNYHGYPLISDGYNTFPLETLIQIANDQQKEIESLKEDVKELEQSINDNVRVCELEEQVEELEGMIENALACLQ